jgi:hypothetical protein
MDMHARNTALSLLVAAALLAAPVGASASNGLEAIDPADLVLCLGGTGEYLEARQDATTRYGADWVVLWTSRAPGERWEVSIYSFSEEAAAEAALASVAPRSPLASDVPLRFGTEVVDPDRTDDLTRERVANCLGAARWPSPTEATAGSAGFRAGGGVTVQASGLPVVPASDIDANEVDPGASIDVSWADPLADTRLSITGGGLSTPGTYDTASTYPDLALLLVVVSRGESLSYLSADGECSVVIDRLATGTIEGSFTCAGVAEQSGGSRPVDASGTFSATRTPVALASPGSPAAP